MHRRFASAVTFLVFGVFSCCSPAARAQTSVGLSVYGAFSGTTNGNGVQESPSNAAGGLIELRHISNPLAGYEVSYSYNRANESYFSPNPCPPAATSCDPYRAVSANAHQLDANWVISVHLANLRPFALAGVGLLLDEPAGGQSGATSNKKPVFDYGAGLDWGLLPHLGLRFQYRGNLYKAPDLTTAFSSTDAFRHTAEPMIGAYFSF